jgi:hypothetical protein
MNDIKRVSSLPGADGSETFGLEPSERNSFWTPPDMRTNNFAGAE